MVDQFFVFLQLGLTHIADIRGFDHILFIITLCSIFRYTEWKKVAILVTAFTIGHSVTLALSALNIIVANRNFIEVLIPITILITSIYNLFYNENKPNNSIRISYILALCFGFIHGMGFSNYFNELMGGSINIAFPLFSFNLGLEIGQLLIVGVFMAIYLILQKIVKFSHKNWSVYFSGAGTAMSILLILQRV
jgi:hypothetical protein